MGSHVRSGGFHDGHYGRSAAEEVEPVVLQSIVEIAAGAMLHGFTQRRPDRAGVAVVAIRGHPVRGNIGDGRITVASKAATNQCVGSSAHDRQANSVEATMNCATSSVAAPALINIFRPTNGKLHRHGLPAERGDRAVAHIDFVLERHQRRSRCRSHGHHHHLHE
jgi:hypothetical protein